MFVCEFKANFWCFWSFRSLLITLFVNKRKVTKIPSIFTSCLSIRSSSAWCFVTGRRYEDKLNVNKDFLTGKASNENSLQMENSTWVLQWSFQVVLKISRENLMNLLLFFFENIHEGVVKSFKGNLVLCLHSYGNLWGENCDNFFNGHNLFKIL